MRELLRRIETLEAKADAAPVDTVTHFLLTDLQAENAAEPWNPNHAQCGDREIWRGDGEAAEDFRARAVATFPASDRLANLISIGRD